MRRPASFSVSDIRADIARHLAQDAGAATPVWAVGGTSMDKAPEAARGWLRTIGWKPTPGHVAIVPGEGRRLGGAVLGLGEEPNGPGRCAFGAGALPGLLPEGDYRLADGFDDPPLSALAFLLGSYVFDRYLSGDPRPPRRIVAPSGSDAQALLNVAQATWLARDLINTPANDLGPAELEQAAFGVADHFGATRSSIVGEALSGKGFRLHHAVGRASDRLPRLVDFAWRGSGAGDGAHKLTLVGKGVCFDTGGLNVKTGGSMTIMKKDMGGAAAALALAMMIMAADLPLRLRVLIPAADNNIAANAFRPGDVIQSRAGLTVEIANTDAEGRLLLADAISLADEEAPDTLLVFATLTGAARVALGPDLPALYTEDDSLAAALAQAGARVCDPLWRMPFWTPYDAYLKSETADLANASANGFAGSIVAAMFLKRFVKRAGRFAHIDLYGWTPRATPGKPFGGEPQTARAAFAALASEFAPAAPS